MNLDSLMAKPWPYMIKNSGLADDGVVSCVPDTGYLMLRTFFDPISRSLWTAGDVIRDLIEESFR